MLPAASFSAGRVTFEAYWVYGGAGTMMPAASTSPHFTLMTLVSWGDLGRLCEMMEWCVRGVMKGPALLL